MQTDRLIQELSGKAKPVKRLPPPSRRCLRWLGSALFYMGIGVAIIGFRSDLEQKFTDLSFLVQAALTLSVAILSAVGAFALSIPAKEKFSLTRIAPLAAFAGWVLYLIVSLTTSPWAALSPGRGLSCIQDIFVFALPPAAFLFIMINRAAPLMLRWTGALISLSVAAFGALGTQLICQNDDLLHILLWHVIPVLVIGGIGTVLGQMLLRWERR